MIRLLSSHGIYAQMSKILVPWISTVTAHTRWESYSTGITFALSDPLQSITKPPLGRPFKMFVSSIALAPCLPTSISSLLNHPNWLLYNGLWWFIWNKTDQVTSKFSNIFGVVYYSKCLGKFMGSFHSTNSPDISFRSQHSDVLGFISYLVILSDSFSVLQF